MTRHTREPQHLILHLYGSSWVKIYRKIRIKRRKKVVRKGSLFEAASAMGTVGLTLGITPSLHKISLYVLILLMYMGRVGGLTLIYAVFSGKNKANARFPMEKVMIG